MDQRITFGAWVREQRQALGLTQAELAQRVPCSAAAIRKIEADQRRPSAQIAQRLAESLGIPPQHHADWVSAARSPSTAVHHAVRESLRPPAHLPASSTPLFGRDADLAAIRQHLLGETRLLTLIGPPGVGKTRLGLQTAADVRDFFADGVYFVPLAPIPDSTQVSSTLAQTLDLGDDPSTVTASRLAAALSDQQMLLVLDNFEHVIDAASLVSDLLAACPYLKIVATSRTALRLRAERRYEVAPLTLPPAQPVTMQVAGQSPAVALFVDRAQAVSPDFALTDQNAPAVAALCQRLDGLPLAIELIAARTRLLEPYDLLDRLDRRIMLATDGLRDGPDRLRTLESTIGWSYDLLTPDEQRLFARLSVFANGWTLEAAEAFCGEGLAITVLDGVQSLLDKSLIYRTAGAADQRRFGMLVTIHEYAQARLAASPEAAAIQAACARYYLAFAEQAGAALTSPEQGVWLQRLEAEHTNLRMVLAWAITHQEAELAVRMGAALWRFWYMHLHFYEGESWLRQALSLTGDLEPELKATALKAHGNMLQYNGDLLEAVARYQDALALYQLIGDLQGVNRCLSNLGMSMLNLGDLDAAYAHFEACLAAAQRAEDQYGIGLGLRMLGEAVVTQGDYGRGRAYFAQSLELNQDLGHIEAVLICKNWLAMIAMWTGDVARAREGLNECLSIARELSDTAGQVVTKAALARAILLQGDIANAAQVLAEAMNGALESPAMLRPIVWHRFFAHTVETAAHLAAINGQIAQAATLLGSAAALREKAWSEVSHAEHDAHIQLIASLHEGVSEQAFTAAWERGRHMTLEQALEFALSEDKVNK